MAAFNLGYPGSGSCNFFEIEPPGIDEFVQIHIAIVALYNFHTGIKGFYYLLHPCKFRGLHLRSLVQQHDIAELNLFYYKTFKVFIINILACKGIAACKLALHPQGIHYRNNTVKFGIDKLLGADLRNRADGLGDGTGLTDAAGLDYDVVELVHPAKFGKLGYEIHLEGATDASVLQGDQAVVTAAHDTSLLNKVGIYIDFAYIIDYYSEFNSFFVCKYAVQQRCLAASKIPGNKQYRNLFFFKIDCHLFCFYFITAKIVPLT